MPESDVEFRIEIEDGYEKDLRTEHQITILKSI